LDDEDSFREFVRGRLNRLSRVAYLPWRPGNRRLPGHSRSSSAGSGAWDRGHGLALSL